MLLCMSRMMNTSKATRAAGGEELRMGRLAARKPEAMLDALARSADVDGRRQGTIGGADPLVAELVTRLPRAGERWSAAEIAQWVQAAESVLTLAHGEAEKAEPVTTLEAFHAVKLLGPAIPRPSDCALASRR